MKRGDYLAIMLLFFAPFPFISTHCLASFSAKFMKDTSERTIQNFSGFISDFRVKQLISTSLTIILFGISLTVAYFNSSLNLPHVSWLTIASTMLITNAAFDQLAWKMTWSGEALIDLMNRWYFRIMYSTGVFLLFLALLQ